ncbi:unnamed protein product [Ixodes persulcatus]
MFFLPRVRSSPSSRTQTAHRGHRVKNVYQNLIQVQTLQGKLCRPEGILSFKQVKVFFFFFGRCKSLWDNITGPKENTMNRELACAALKTRTTV